MSTPVHDNESSPAHEEKADRMVDSFSAAAEAMAQAAPTVKVNGEPAHALSHRAIEIAAIVVSDLKAHLDHLCGKHEGLSKLHETFIEAQECINTCTHEGHMAQLALKRDNSAKLKLLHLIMDERFESLEIQAS